MKKAIITGGSCFHEGLFRAENGKFANIFDDRIYIKDLQFTNLAPYNLVVIASRLYPRFLTSNAEKFQHYLENGGNLVSFGEIMGDYLPNVEFQESEVNFWWWIHKGADLPLYASDPTHKIWNFLEVKECKWHYHGTYTTPKHAEKILVDELGRAIMYKDSYTSKGTLYLTSLDPDYHIGQGFMPTTIPFFEKFMRYVESDIKGMASC